jgi:hypothetical protein
MDSARCQFEKSRPLFGWENLRRIPEGKHFGEVFGYTHVLESHPSEADRKCATIRGPLRDDSLPATLTFPKSRSVGPWEVGACPPAVPSQS